MNVPQMALIFFPHLVPPFYLQVINQVHFQSIFSIWLLFYNISQIVNKPLKL